MKISLDGLWTLRLSEPGQLSLDSAAQERLSTGGIPLRVPGDIMSALLEAGLIPDPYDGTNELEVQWVGQTDWLLSRIFVLDAVQARHPQVWLRIPVLDTVAAIRVNGHELGRVDNMFHPADTLLTGWLHEGENQVDILVLSPEKQARLRAAALPYPIPATPAPVHSPHRNLVRKVQCHAGWDWGPCLMTGGLYQGASLDLVDDCTVAWVLPRQEARGRDFVLSVEVGVSSVIDGTYGVSARILGEEALGMVTVVNGTGTLTLELVVKEPTLWWPRGYGEATLHSLEVQAGSDHWQGDIGFRTVQVLNQKDAHGTSFGFRVNGRDIFARGANWIPIDALPARQADERAVALLEEAAAAHMNMIRVWGGGQYESDAFYRACDRLGIMVWQDFMFSCSLYPVNQDFLDSVRLEVTHQVRRLSWHPSLALWCGNNENLGALGWYDESKAQPARYIIDYDRLTEGVIGTTVDRLDTGRTFWPTSPSAGRREYADTWHLDGHGDMHFWSVWHEGKPFEAYRGIKPRFVSEFGYQSFPSMETVARFAPSTQWNVTSPVMEHHQKNRRGNTIMVENFARYFLFPRGFEAMLYLSQVQQAMAIETALSYWRSLRPVCLGALVWQLNDVWPVASWASIEYSGAWKLLHYRERHNFAPQQVFAFIGPTGDLEVHAVNDGNGPLAGTLEVSWRAPDGSVIHRQVVDQVQVPQDSAQKVLALPPAAWPVSGTTAFVTVRLDAEAGPLEHWTFLGAPKDFPMADPILSHEVSALPDGSLRITLRSRAVAFWVRLSAPGVDAWFSDNGFLLLPDEVRTLDVRPRRINGRHGGWKPKPLTLEHLQASLRVEHLYQAAWG